MFAYIGYIYIYWIYRMRIVVLMGSVPNWIWCLLAHESCRLSKSNLTWNRNATNGLIPVHGWNIKCKCIVIFSIHGGWYGSTTFYFILVIEPMKYSVCAFSPFNIRPTTKLGTASIVDTFSVNSNWFYTFWSNDIWTVTNLLSKTALKVIK